MIRHNIVIHRLLTRIPNPIGRVPIYAQTKSLSKHSMDNKKEIEKISQGCGVGVNVLMNPCPRLIASGGMFAGLSISIPNADVYGVSASAVVVNGWMLDNDCQRRSRTQIPGIFNQISTEPSQVKL